MTKQGVGEGGGGTRPGTAARRCRWCGRPFQVAAGPGRPREYCRRSCRQRDYEARRLAASVGLDDSRVIVARTELDDLHDRLYALEAALEDVRHDLAAAARPGEAEYKEALEWLMAAAQPLVQSSRPAPRSGAVMSPVSGVPSASP